MFRMNGYVQDVRYFAIEHMEVRREVFPARTTLVDVRRDCVSFAQCLSITWLKSKRCVTSYAPYEWADRRATHLSYSDT